MVGYGEPRLVVGCVGLSFGDVGTAGGSGEVVEVEFEPYSVEGGSICVEAGSEKGISNGDF